MKSHLRLVISILIFTSSVSAQEASEEAIAEPSAEAVVFEAPASTAEAPAQSPQPTTGLVEVEYPEGLRNSYRAEREGYGFMFDVNYHYFRPKKYISVVDNGTYNDVFANSPIAIMELQFSYKYNFSLGALTLGLAYGLGSTSNAPTVTTTTGTVTYTDRKMDVSKPGVTFGYVMDALFDEPYVAPYFQMEAWQMTIKESSTTADGVSTSFSGQTKMGFSYTVGALLQLNWLEQDVAEKTEHNYGIDNTYLDLFAIQYSKTQSSNDANTESDVTYGAGLRLEF